jgi:murein L,D-transpeptidase YafK
VKQYPVSTGRDAGDKQREGDYRTPEGEFYVCVKNASSKYTRALGLSYPGVSDAQRGLREGLITQREHDRIVYAIRNRHQPPWKTPLGGEIMIHGDRRGGRTTQGCIALEDRDILELFPKIPLGTRVIIRP